ncbi:MAG: response regulator transcription factor [Leptospirales bacterium]|nr:response regulator transcription factor [Leptospirales bacterium]
MAKGSELQSDLAQSGKSIRVLLADDHEIVRQGLRQMLARDESVEVVGEASDGDSTLNELQRSPCDILILDLSMPGINGFELIRQLAAAQPALRIVVLTMHREAKYVRQATGFANVFGYILKDEAFDQLQRAVHKVAAGNRMISSQVHELIFEDYRSMQESALVLETLTRREREILDMVLRGKMNKEIANDLFISVRTVESHRAKIMEKLRVRNVAELMRFAAEHGLV